MEILQKIPNLSEEEVLKILDKVLTVVSQQFPFGVYSTDDIYQEGFLICVEQLLPAYTGQSPLENYLNVSLRNRMRNFIRDNSTIYHFRCPLCNNENTPNCVRCTKSRLDFAAKKNVTTPLNIDDISEDILSYDWFDIENENSEFSQLISRNLPISMRAGYLKLKDGINIPKSRKDEVISRIRDILIQNDFLDESENND